jgi:hypothetical protein
MCNYVASSLTIATNGGSGLGSASTILTEVQRSGVNAVTASLIQLTGIEKGVNITNSSGGMLNINLYDPTASLLTGDGADFLERWVHQVERADTAG